MSWDRRDGLLGLDGAGLPSSLSQLLESERAAPPPGAERLGRLEARLSQTLGIVAFAPPVPDPGAGAGAAVEGGGALLGGAPAGASGGLLAQLGATVSKPIFAALLAAGLGTGTYVGVYHAVSLGQRAAAPRAVPATPLPVPPPLPSPPLPSLVGVRAAADNVGAAPAGGVTRAASPARRAPRAAAARARDLSAELKALGRARASLRDDPQRALAELRAHEQAFPAGRLALEREVLIIEALARAGDDGAAAARAETFRRRHPGSTLEPALARALSAAQ